ncbi:MAG: glycolate oxidase subunit GlcF [Gammaproteobacteria bacterium]|nr:glycolate oxidase subunit GlcF [Gammaproteobacteria bacterium]
MKTQLPEEIAQSPSGQLADAILRSCVHCGFCNAACPTYQLLGNELDGPRGRIYLIKQMLEGHPATRLTQTHLDRCLGCRSCETSCPSGVQYAKLLAIGRETLEPKLKRPARERWLRGFLRWSLANPKRFRVMLRLGHQFRRYLPAMLKEHIPAQLPKPAAQDHWPKQQHKRHVIFLVGCVQPVMLPEVDLIAARVLDRLGISVVHAGNTGCCGAASHHLTYTELSHQQIRNNIDEWWQLLVAGAEAIISTSSACTAMIKEYAHLMRDDPEYAQRASRVSGQTYDLSELLARELAALTPDSHIPDAQRIALHMPCSAQHGQALDGPIRDILQKLGFVLAPVTDPHLCCGAAGTYSITQPALARQLRSNKLAGLHHGNPTCIATANVGCQLFLQQESVTPVRHWIELVEARLTGASLDGLNTRLKP